MGEITLREIEEKEKWDSFLKSHPEANFLQSWQWGEFHKSLNHKIFRIGLYNKDKLKGVFLCIVEKAKRARYLTVPGGPILNWKNNLLINAFKNGIIKISKENKCSFIRVRPQLESNNFSKNLFKKMGFKNSPMHLHAELTNRLDIKKTEQELLSNMRKTTRYEIKKAEKIGIRIEESKNYKDVRSFYNLQLKTARRQGFIPFSLKYLQEQFKCFSSFNQAILYSAYYKKKLLAQAFIIFYGNEAVYHYGASTNNGRKYPGAYLIQWKAIQEAKKRGLKIYNFWGVAREKKHRFFNLSLFKRGFGGEDFEYLHAQDMVINKPLYFINYIVETIRKKIRKI